MSELPPLEVSQRTRKRVAGRLLPFIFIIFLINCIDWSGVPFAHSRLSHELGFSGTVYGLGAGLFVIGYVVLGVPGAIIVERWSARKWIACIMISWGVFTVLSGFIRTAGQFYITRFALGLAEASLFPGLLAYLTHWFRSQDRARAISCLYASIPAASLISAPIAGLLLERRWLGMSGWRWLFVVEGMPAILLGIITIFYLTDWPFRANWLSKDEREWLTTELEGEKNAKKRIDDYTIWEALSDKRIWLLTLAWCSLVVNFTVASILMNMFVKSHSGLSNSTVATLFALVALAGLVGIVVNSWHSDRTGERRWHAIIPLAICGLLYLLVIAIQQSFPLTIALFVLFGLFVRAAYPVVWSLPSVILSGSAAAATFGLINSIGRLGGVAGPIALGFLSARTHSLTAGFAFTGFAYLLSAVLLLLLRIDAPVSGTSSGMIFQGRATPLPSQDDLENIVGHHQSQQETNLGMSCLRIVRQQRAKALWRALAWAFGCNLLLLFLLGGISLTVGYMLGLYVYWKHSQGNAVVLWFRRFHTGMVRRTRFNSLLHRAIRGIGGSVSIQDSSFRYSYWVRPGRMFLLYFSWFAVFLACYVFSLFLVMPIWTKLNLKSNPDPTIAVVFVITVIAVISIAVWYVRKRAYVSLEAQEWSSSLDKVLSGILDRKSVLYGTVLIRCEDAFWQQAVCQALTKATAAIIDLSEMSENVLWELQTALARLPPSCIILAFPTGGETPDVLPDTFRSKLGTRINTNAIGSCSLFGYPSRVGWWFTRGSMSKAKELQRKIAHAVETRNLAIPVPKP